MEGRRDKAGRQAGDVTPHKESGELPSSCREFTKEAKYMPDSRNKDPEWEGSSPTFPIFFLFHVCLPFQGQVKGKYGSLVLGHKEKLALEASAAKLA